jgi:galactose-1-phosphate uridylyltransferase (family 1)
MMGLPSFVPYWAVWPFETLLISKRHVAAIDAFSVDESDFLAAILRQVATRYDNLFETSFSYSMGFHQRPGDQRSHSECHFHGQHYPLCCVPLRYRNSWSDTNCLRRRNATSHPRVRRYAFVS